MKFLKRMKSRLRHWATWRCAEPVVVFESDDWGMRRRACAKWIRPYGVPSEWADEESETPADLDHLYGVLSRHRDAGGRPACFTANFVVANPDFDAIRRDRFERYHDFPIGDDERLRAKWQEGMGQRVLPRVPCPAALLA